MNSQIDKDKLIEEFKNIPFEMNLNVPFGMNINTDTINNSQTLKNFFVLPMTPEKNIRESFDPYYNNQKYDIKSVKFEYHEKADKIDQLLSKVDPNNFNVSKYIEEFIYSNKKELDLTELKGVILEFCYHKEGSRLLQDAIGIGSPTQLKLIFQELKDNIIAISNDQSGNYCIQKIFEGMDDQ